jgi:hypothetical protein
MMKSMKPCLAYSLCAAIFATVVASVPAAAQINDRFSGRVAHLHRPMTPYRNPEGTFMRFKGEVEDENWSGYAVTTGAPYSSASATWQVPNATYDGGQTPYGYEYVFNWVGIGGASDGTLIQLGTESIVSTSGATAFYAWYELYPALDVGISLNVNPGDIITASLQCTATCSPGQPQTWRLSLTDETTKGSWTQSFQYQSSMASAEWITEPPYYDGTYNGVSFNGFLPLADYKQATYDPVEANGANPNLSLSANGYIAVVPTFAETSNPSGPINGDDFSTCWGAKGAGVTSCTAGSISAPASTDPPPPPPPGNVSVTLTATPATTTAPGQSSKLTWTSQNATSCQGSGFSAGSHVTGPFAWALVFPKVTTSYAITCTGADGSATSMVTMTVK